MNDYEKYEKEMNELHNTNSESIKVDIRGSKRNKLFNNKIRLENLWMGIFIVIIALLGIVAILKNDGEGVMYYFGMIFFIAGYFVGIKVPAFGIIFLFSHGMTGLGIMLAALSDTQMNDFPIDLKVFDDISITNISYTAIGYIFLVLGFITAIIYNLSIISGKVREKDYLKLVPIGIFTVGLVIIAFHDYIVNLL